MSHAIALYNRIENPITAAKAIGEDFAKSGLFGCQNPAQGVILALACLSENKTPFDIAREYDIVDGKLRKKALAIFADFRGRGGKVRWIETGKDGKTSSAEFTFEGQTLTEQFSIEEARSQGLIRPKSAWEKTPANMLRARVLSNAIAMLCPEIIAGVSDNPEDNTEAAEPKTLLKTKAEPELKQAKVTKSETIELPPAEVIVQPAEPVIPPTPERKRVSSWSNPKDPQKVSAEGAAALQEAIGEANAETVLRWLEAKNWIEPKGSLLHLSPARAQRIYRDTEQFLSHVKGTKEAKG